MASVPRRRQNHYYRSSSSSLAAKAISASSAHIDSSLSSAYYASSTTTTATATPPAEESNSGFAFKYNTNSNSNSNTVKTSRSNEEGKNGGFWGNLARKAKSILEDTADPENSPRSTPTTTTTATTTTTTQSQHPTPTLQKGLGAIASSLTYIGNAVEGGLSIVENRTADIIQETRKHIRKKPTGVRAKNQQGSFPQSQTMDGPQSEQEIQLKASRDVAMAMAAKAKVLLRELKTVKADLAFAKERCAQLEEENKYLRETRERGGGPDDDDLIRLQLESLLAEKARLAHENSIYARENRFLREVVEYHQLTMQDVVYLDESAEEVSEVYPSKVPLVSHVPADSASESLPYPISPLSSTSQHKTEGTSPQPVPSLDFGGVAAGRRLQ